MKKKNLTNKGCKKKLLHLGLKYGLFIKVELDISVFQIHKFILLELQVKAKKLY